MHPCSNIHTALNTTMHSPSSWSSSHAILASLTAWNLNYLTSCSSVTGLFYDWTIFWMSFDYQNVIWATVYESHLKIGQKVRYALVPKRAMECYATPWRLWRESRIFLVFYKALCPLECSPLSLFTSAVCMHACTPEGLELVHDIR